MNIEQTGDSLSALYTGLPIKSAMTEREIATSPAAPRNDVGREEIATSPAAPRNDVEGKRLPRRLTAPRNDVGGEEIATALRLLAMT